MTTELYSGPDFYGLMIQHGTWEAKRQNYHEAQLREAKEAAAKKKKEEEGDDEAIA